MVHILMLLQFKLRQQFQILQQTFNEIIKILHKQKLASLGQRLHRMEGQQSLITLFFGIKVITHRLLYAKKESHQKRTQKTA